MGAVAMHEVLDAVAIEDMKVRWRLAEQYLLGASENPDAGKLALHALVSHDVPILLQELKKRLDPGAFAN
jgi:hypothetical protein